MKGIHILAVRWRARLVLLAVILATGTGTAFAQETALDHYIARPDPNYAWRLVGTIAGEGYKGYVIDLTSQAWRTAADVDRPIWQHWLTVTKPDKAASNKAILFIGGGSNRDPAPTAVSARSAGFALETNTVVADLGMVPNQPLFFADSKDQGSLRRRPHCIQ